MLNAKEGDRHDIRRRQHTVAAGMMFGPIGLFFIKCFSVMIKDEQARAIGQCRARLLASLCLNAYRSMLALTFVSSVSVLKFAFLCFHVNRERWRGDIKRSGRRSVDLHLGI